MKKILFVLLFLSACVASVRAQVRPDQVDSLIDVIRGKVREIDAGELYKAKLEPEGFKPADYTSVYDWLFEIYYDREGTVKKINSVYSPDYSHCITYFDTDGTAIYTSYYSNSMLSSYSIERYLDGNGDIIYIDHVSRDDYFVPSSTELLTDEKIVRRAKKADCIPFVDDVFYDNIASADDFIAQFIRSFDFEGQRYEGEFPIAPEELKYAVKFIKPSKGEVTSITRNGVPVFKKPTRESLILFTLDIRRDIEITDVKGDWYKISMTTYGGDSIEGFVHGDYLAPVERAVR